jgi:hypothetical protein
MVLLLHLSIKSSLTPLGVASVPATFPTPSNPNKMDLSNRRTITIPPICLSAHGGMIGPDNKAGRAMLVNLTELGGYNTFVGAGFYVNHTFKPQKYLWCSRPGG